MIGKSLRDRYALGLLPPDRAIAALEAALPSQAAHLVAVRAKGASMVACLVVSADRATIRLCRTLGFDVNPGGAGVFGLLGADAARLFAHLSEERRAWLAAPSGPRETKVLLIAGGAALLSLTTNDGKVAITAAP
jgi:hypothetical protein